MGTLCLSSAALFKAGANVSTALVEADYNYAILQAESQIIVDSGFNWIPVYLTLSTDVRFILEQACSAKAGILLINYDPDAMGRSTAVSKQNVLAWEYNLAIKLLREQDKRAFIQKA